MKHLLTLIALGALLFIAAPAAQAGGYHEKRFSHYDTCGRPVYVNVYVPRRVCPPPVVAYPRWSAPRVYAPARPYYGYYSRPRVGFSFTYCR